MSQLIKKAIFPVAGLGTRFLPVTKANPKEMLPIVDKPLIQFAVEEALAIGVEQLIFITSTGKRAIEDYFDTHYELEAKLEERQKLDLLEAVKNILPKGVSCVYIRQAKPLGLGHAVWCAREVVGDQPCAVLLADDLIESHQQSCLQEMAQRFEETNASIIAVQAVEKDQTDRYGIVDCQSDGRLSAIVEKPKPQYAPSNLAAVGRYILTPGIFKQLSQLGKGAGGEIQLTDAIAGLIREEAVYAHQFTGKRYDCGCKLGYLQAVMTYGVRHPEIGQEFKRFIEEFDYAT